jgi:hypothetical protein
LTEAWRVGDGLERLAECRPVRDHLAAGLEATGSDSPAARWSLTGLRWAGSYDRGDTAGHRVFHRPAPGVLQEGRHDKLYHQDRFLRQMCVLGFCCRIHEAGKDGKNKKKLPAHRNAPEVFFSGYFYQRAAPVRPRVAVFSHSSILVVS